MLPHRAVARFGVFGFGILGLSLLPVQALQNGLSLTPPMGWNSWNAYTYHINEKVIRQAADGMVSSGMAAAGYRYINIDDCWSLMDRDADGNLVADPEKFPSGMKALADYIHSKGLLFGIYSDRGSKTCSGNPGSGGHEAQDVALWASWGVDFLKYDNCNADGDKRTQYEIMRDVLAASKRPMVYSICAWSFEDWMPGDGNLWRTTGDISPTYASLMENLDKNAGLAAYAKPGAWNDPDMLEVGNGGLSEAENRSHFSLWAIMAAPLIAGNDLGSMSPFVTSVLTNPEVIAVDQDSLGKQGTRIRTTDGVELWSKPLRDGGVAVLVFNRSGAAPASLTFNLAEVGVTQSSTAKVRDLWAHADKGEAAPSYTATVAPHDVAMFKLTPGLDQVPPTIAHVYTSPDSARNVTVEFDEPLNKAAAETRSNYALDQGLGVDAASLQADLRTVKLAVSKPMDTGVDYRLTVNKLKDTSGNTIADNSAISFRYDIYKPITKIRYYPRPGWEGRMVGGIFEGTRSTDKLAGPYVTLHTVTKSPAGNAWNEVTDPAHSDMGYRFVRYRAPVGGYGNIAEIEFYSNSTKLTGAAFGTTGSFNGPSDDFTKVFDGDVKTFFDCPQADGAYAGLSLIKGDSPVSIGPSKGYRPMVSSLAKGGGRVFDLRGRMGASGPMGFRVSRAPASALYLVKRPDGSVALGCELAP